MRKIFLLSAVLLIPACGWPMAAPPQSEARLLAEVQWIQPGTPFLLALAITLPEHWHSYWSNPGDSGMAPTLDWRLPAGFTAGPVLWPCPQLLAEPPLWSFGYEHEMVLLREIRPPADLAAGTEYGFDLKAAWLVCRDICVPQRRELRLVLPARAAPPTTVAAVAPLFARAQQELPVVNPAWKVQVVADQATLVLRVWPPADVAAELLTRAVFFPAQQNLIKYGPQTWSRVGEQWSLRLDRVSGAGALPTRLQGVLAIPRASGTGSTALAVDVQIPVSKE